MFKYLELLTHFLLKLFTAHLVHHEGFEPPTPGFEEIKVKCRGFVFLHHILSYNIVLKGPKMPENKGI